jgi:hypothetical protein
MLSFWIGAVIFVLTSLLFWRSLPSGGRTARFIGTELEPYVSVAIVLGITIGTLMTLSWALFGVDVTSLKGHSYE